jgi:hypothetical protein
MATYRIGQRCKLVNCENAPNEDFHGCNGDEVTILGPLGEKWPGQYPISVPAHFPINGLRAVHVPPFRLAPLTDPRADEFIARLEKLGREPVIQPVKVEVER